MALFGPGELAGTAESTETVYTERTGCQFCEQHEVEGMKEKEPSSSSK